MWGSRRAEASGLCARRWPPCWPLWGSRGQRPWRRWCTAQGRRCYCTCSRWRRWGRGSRGCRAQGPGPRVQEPGFRVQGPGSIGFRVQGPGFRSLTPKLSRAVGEGEARQVRVGCYSGGSWVEEGEGSLGSRVPTYRVQTYRVQRGEVGGTYLGGLVREGRWEEHT